MESLRHLNLGRIPTFLPQALIPKTPKFFVWFTGTLGQAEWLISHSRQLRGHSLPISCPKSPNDKDVLIPWNKLPKKLKPLMSLEQPDLIVTDSEGVPLISIEITEQQPVGLNAQQRMGRFWSAVANRVPCAYLLPIEGYQIEKANTGAIKAFEEKDLRKRELKLRIAQLPNLNETVVAKANVTTLNDLESAIRRGLLKLSPEAKLDLEDHVSKHLSPGMDVLHIKEIDVHEYIHRVGSGYQKAYIRKAGIPGSMLLQWFKVCNEITPAAAFQLPISYKTLFRSNGRAHTVVDEENPHLSFRNLPPAPGSFPPVNKRVNKDEITLFFEMLDSVLKHESPKDLGREELTDSNEFYSSRNVADQQVFLTKTQEFHDRKSADFLLHSQLFEQLLLENGFSHTNELKSLINHFKEISIYKIYCGAPTRSLGDPYTGALAVRDLLFTRDLSSLKNGELLNFERKSGLVFWVDLVDGAATRHKFIEKKVQDIYKANFKDGRDISVQQKIIEIVNSLRAEEVPKDIRAHILFSDLIVIRRVKSRGVEFSVLHGVPSLLRLGLINSKATFLESLRI
jgi:hypothetical protein